MKPSHRPDSSPPMWAELSIPGTMNPNARLMMINVPIWPTSDRPRRSSTGWCVRDALMRIPNRPKIAPDAPTDGISLPNTKLPTEPAAAQSR